MKRLSNAPSVPSLLTSLVALLAWSACAGPRPLDGPRTADGPRSRTLTAAADGVSGEGVEANWKERLAQPYVFVEHGGDYRLLGESMRRLLETARELGVEPDGPPFALFYDDPGRVPLAELRARACLPVAGRPARLAELQYELLPRAMVVYARVTGPYPEAARGVPALFRYLGELGWQQGGPVREIYLVDPGSVQSYEELVTEVQIPWTAGAR